MSTTQFMADPELLATEWNLAPLVDGNGEKGVRRLLEQATERAKQLAATYSGRIETLDAGELREAMMELAELEDIVGRAASYAMLRFSTDTADPARGALLAHMQEQATAISTMLLEILV